MDLLREVEDILGDVESWPTYLIYDIFVVEPNRHSVKKVAAFFYGKGISIEKAVDYFIACIEIVLYKCALRDWYSIWDKNPYTAHKEWYYSTTLKRWMWINGNALCQQEAAWPEVGVTQFGTENTGYEQLIRTRIEHILYGRSGKI